MAFTKKAPVKKPVMKKMAAPSKAPAAKMAMASEKAPATKASAKKPFAKKK